MSEFRRNLDGSFIYRRELEYVFRIIFKSEEENYSRGKRFGDKFVNCFIKRFTVEFFMFP